MGNKIQYRIWLWVVLLVMVLGMAACGRGTDGKSLGNPIDKSQDKSDYSGQWTAATEEIQGAEGYPMQLGSLRAVDGGAYYRSIENGVHRLIFASADEKRVQEICRFDSPMDYCVSGDGKLIACFVAHGDGGFVHFMDARGEVLRELQVEAEISGGQFPRRMAVSAKGELAILFGGRLVLWDADGGLAQDMEINANIVWEMSAVDAGIGADFGADAGIGADFGAGSDGGADFLLSTFDDDLNKGWILEAKVGSGELREVKRLEEKPDFLEGYPFSWRECGLARQDVLGVSAGQGKYFAWSSNWTMESGKLYLSVIAPSAGVELGEASGAAAGVELGEASGATSEKTPGITEKKKVRVVKQGNDAPLEAMALAFNRQSTDVEVVVECLGYESDAWNKRLSSKEPVDMVVLYGDFGLLQKAGYLEPIDVYLEQLGQDLDEIIPSILDYWRVDGKTYGVPHDINFHVPCVRISGGAGLDGCTPEQFVELCREHPEMKSENGLLPFEILRLCMLGNMDIYLEERDGTLQLAVDRLSDLCEAIKGVQSDWSAYYDQWEELLESGEPLCWEAVICNARSLAELYQKAGEDLELIGYPQENGRLNAVVQSGAMCLMKKRGCTEEALQFMRFYCEHFEEYYPGEKWEGTLDGLVGQLEEAGKEQPLPDGTKWSLSEEQKEMMLRLVEGSKSKNSRFDQIYMILSEELGGYFAGDRRLEDVLDVANSRVRIFLAE